METFMPEKVIEWIPYNRFQDITYLTEGGFSKIYTAFWIDGPFIIWNSKEQQLIRLGRRKVVLKRLENVENANQDWLNEVGNLKVFK
jgi:hypothetical protein